MIYDMLNKIFDSRRSYQSQFDLIHVFLGKSVNFFRIFVDWYMINHLGNTKQCVFSRMKYVVLTASACDLCFEVLISVSYAEFCDL